MFITNKKNMKLLLLILAITSFSLLNSKEFNKTEKFSFKRKPPIFTTLDSLQGHWVNDEDSTNKVFIQDRNWTEYKTDGSNAILSSSAYKIYFSDTGINTISTPTPIFDSLKKTGIYILYKSLQDTTFDCQYIGGFYYEAHDTFVVFEPKFGFPKGNPTFLYKKIH